MFNLRQYQKDILNDLYKKLQNNRKIALGLPTGAGKTVMMAAWAQKMSTLSKRTVIIVDRMELVDQTFKLLPSASVLKSGRKYTFDSKNLIQIVMLQTGYRRMQMLLDMDVDYVFFDEVHNYYEGQMFAAICDCWSDAKIIGVSATPINDRGYLLEGFDDIINEIQAKDLIDAGYLAKPTHFTPSDYNLDLSCIRITGGDYDYQQLDEIMTDTSRVKQIYEEWKKIATDRKTIVFCSSIAQAHTLCGLFRHNGVHCEVVHSQMSYDDRETYLYNFKIGILRVIFNVGILVAGFDDPTVDCVLFANPTKVLRRYLQQAGRGLRVAPDKKDCLILDCANNIREHGFCDDIRIYRKKLKTTDQCTVKQCPECGAIVTKSVKICPYCNYDFSMQVEEHSTSTRRTMQALEKAFNMQQELKQQIGELVRERGHKSGYRWFLFIDCLKTKRPTESAIRFFKRKLTKIKNIRKKKWKLAALKYD